MSQQFTEQQLRAIGERRAELAVSAAAGSGKTSVLVERVLRAVCGESGPALPVESILIVTFTRAAAAELRGRLYKAQRERMRSALSADSTELNMLRAQLSALPRAQISTIDSFCAEIVRRFGYRLGLPEARVMRESEAQLTRHELATSFLDERLGSRDERLIRLALAWGGSDGIGPQDLAGRQFSGGLWRPLLRLYDFSRTLVEREAWFSSFAERIRLDPENFDFDVPVIQQLERELVDWVERTQAHDAHSAALLQAEAPAALYTEILSRRAAVLRMLTLRQGWDRARALLDLLKEKQDDIKYKPDLLQGYRRDIERPAQDLLYAWIERRNKPVQEEAKKWRDFFSRDWADVAAQENEAVELAEALWQLALEFGEVYGRYKRERAMLDFSDLERSALELLRAGDGEVASELAAQFAMVLIDEHQDTNELQDAIIDAVTPAARADETGAVISGRPRFVVGDLKQSIYGFRLATPELFRETCRRLESAAPESGQLVRLNANFRSRPLLLAAINRVFLGLFSEELGGEDYAQSQLEAGLDYAALFAEAAVAAQPDRPMRLHLVRARGTEADDSADESAPADYEAEEGEEDRSAQFDEPVYRRVAALLHEIHHEARPLYDKDRKIVRPASWRDMVVLLRSARGRVEPLSAILEHSGIPVYAPGRSGFFERLEISDALSLLDIIDNPRQDIPLAAVLRGPLVGLEALELLDIAQQRLPGDARAEDSPPGHDELWQRLQWFIAAQGGTELGQRMAAFASRIDEWRTAVRREPLPEVLARIFEDSGISTAAAAMSGGRQRLANLLALQEMSREFAGFDKQGLARFLRYIRQSRRAAGDFGDAPTLSEAHDAVRIMTVHQSKGLEFPIVVLPDLHKRFNQQDLGGDVLWHRRAGIGGRYYSLPARRRAQTLSWRAVREALRRDLLAEELRILYVALTRARERLELVGAVDSQLEEQLGAESRPLDARRPLDWLARQFSVEMSAALSLGSALSADGYVELHTEAPVTLSAERRSEAAVEFSADELRALEASLRHEYPYRAALELPAKATVSLLAHRAAASDSAYSASSAEEPEEADGVMQLALPDPVRGAAQPALPQFMQGRRMPSAAEIGSATHRLLSELDPLKTYSSEELARLRDTLAGSRVLDSMAAREIRIEAVAECVGVIRERFGVNGQQFYRELPVGMLIPGRVLAELEGWSIDPAALHASDSVYVQGTLDLLIVSAESVLVLDYKTDREADAATLIARYSRQLQWYCHAASLLLPQRSISWALYGLAGAGLVGPFEYKG